MWRKLILLLLIGLLLTPVAAYAATEKETPLASNFTLPQLDGTDLSLSKYLGKNVTIISFFASWSKSCQKELLFLNDLYKANKKKGLKIIGISYDRKKSQLASFVNENKLGFDIVRDKKLKTLKAYKILIIPTLVVIDSSGKIVSTYTDFDKNVKAATIKDIKKLLK